MELVWIYALGPVLPRTLKVQATVSLQAMRPALENRAGLFILRWKKMRNSTVRYLLIVGSLAGGITELQAQPLEENISRFIPGFEYSLSFRYRMEGVDQDNALLDANASTLRSRLTLSAKPANRLGLIVEIDNVAAVGPDEYDSFALNQYRGLYSIIPDQEGTEVNLAAASFAPSVGHNLILGRQRILHEKQRFIGGVAWRQNEQTYDALTYNYSSDLFDFDYSHLDEVHRIFGGELPSFQITEFDMNGDSLLGTLKQGWGNTSAYVYALDIENAPALSSLTYGLAYSGKIRGFDADLAWARQADYANNPGSSDTNYLAVSFARLLGPVRALLGYERLGSDNGATAFNTPLATLHAFQGWADIFLNTPSAGIEDAYISLSGSVNELVLTGTYHDFNSEVGSADYGSEVDLQASYTFNPTVSAAVKFASYRSDTFSVDTDKLWLTINISF